MKFHEYQTKGLFCQYGIPTPSGAPIKSVGEIDNAVKLAGGYPVVVKAQVLAGGRGKAGGIQFADNADEANKIAKELLGKELATYQSGGEGETIKTLYIEQKSAFDRSLYLGMVVDRQTQSVAVIASAEGGVEIEEVAAKTPEKIKTVAVSPSGYQPYVGRDLAKSIGLEGKLIVSFASLVGKLHKLFVECDASMVEINPLVITPDQKIIALDGKLALDDNAFYRQKKLTELYHKENRHAENSQERQASEIGVNYVALDGNIGCMVNGAGLAMGTMDLIKLFGGEPANFLDIGGGANTEQVRNAFKLLTSSEHVKGILVNIFGGIVHCDRVANGIVQATRELGLTVPVVVRLEGTNMEEGKRILAESGLDLTPADGLEAAAKTIVEKVGA